MDTKILLIDDDPDTVEFTREALIEHGFKDVLTFQSARDIVSSVIDVYTGPCILVTDYNGIGVTPSVFLPKLRAMGIFFPVIIVSGHIRFDSLNSLSVQCGQLFYFQKGANIAVMVHDLAKLLGDLTAEAEASYVAYAMRQDTKVFLDGLEVKHMKALLRMMQFDEASNLIEMLGISKSSLSRLRGSMLAFLGSQNFKARYDALYDALKVRLNMV